MKTIFALMVLLGCLTAQNLTANDTNESVGETINVVGTGTVNILTQDWVGALGALISDGINFIVGEHLVDASIGGAAITIVFLILARARVIAFLTAIISIITSIFIIAIIYIAAHAMKMI